MAWVYGLGKRIQKPAKEGDRISTGDTGVLVVWLVCTVRHDFNLGVVRTKGAESDTNKVKESNPHKQQYQPAKFC